MGSAPSLACRVCGGRAKLLESRPMKTAEGRRRRYGCLDPACGVRWSEWTGGRPEHSLRQAARAAGAAPGGVVRQCRDCGHWLGRCGMEFPEAAQDPSFASLCAAWLDRQT